MLHTSTAENPKHFAYMEDGALKLRLAYKRCGEVVKADF